MNADYVENIIRNIDEKSYTYKCILVDGTWGIGKSYMVRKALEDKKDKAYRCLGWKVLSKYIMIFYINCFFIQRMVEN